MVIVCARKPDYSFIGHLYLPIAGVWYGVRFTKRALTLEVALDLKPKAISGYPGAAGLRAW